MDGLSSPEEVTFPVWKESTHPNPSASTFRMAVLTVQCVLVAGVLAPDPMTREKQERGVCGGEYGLKVHKRVARGREKGKEE